jgi:hypothetical protein
MPRVSYAEKKKLLRGPAGISVGGIKICNKNRVSSFAYREAGIKDLENKLQTEYLEQGINAALYGTATRKKEHPYKFAIYRLKDVLSMNEARALLKECHGFEGIPETKEFVDRLKKQIATFDKTKRWPGSPPEQAQKPAGQ